MRTQGGSRSVVDEVASLALDLRRRAVARKESDNNVPRSKDLNVYMGRCA